MVAPLSAARADRSPNRRLIVVPIRVYLPFASIQYDTTPTIPIPSPQDKHKYPGEKPWRKVNLRVKPTLTPSSFFFPRFPRQFPPRPVPASSAGQPTGLGQRAGRSLSPLPLPVTNYQHLSVTTNYHPHRQPDQESRSSQRPRIFPPTYRQRDRQSQTVPATKTESQSISLLLWGWRKRGSCFLALIAGLSYTPHCSLLSPLAGHLSLVANRSQLLTVCYGLDRCLFVVV